MPVRSVERKIHVIRGQRVMLDRDLAELYMVPTIALRQQVKRNHARFPEDFVFQLSEDEANALVSQLVIPSRRSLGGFLPYAFTQQGVAMLSSVLRSDRAVRVNIAIMRAFVGFHEALLSKRAMTKRLEALERKVRRHDVRIEDVIETIETLVEESRASKRQIGFVTR
ncbi:MAG: ORF6N domain-containing protein [Acidobacteria bacterium]|nr:ORF6N domain-containing protein [Acidobacteriota bacterium]